MDFKEATDDLFDHVDHSKLAKELGVSIAAIRQARLGASAKAHRSPPSEWERAVMRLAQQRLDHYKRLVERLRKSAKPKRF